MYKEKIKFIFKVDEIEQEFEKTYYKNPTKEQIQKDIKEWFFNEYYMWFSVESNGNKINLGDELYGR